MQQILYAVEMGALKPLCDLLVVNDTKTVLVILDAIVNILKVGDRGVRGGEGREIVRLFL